MTIGELVSTAKQNAYLHCKNLTLLVRERERERERKWEGEDLLPSWCAVCRVRIINLSVNSLQRSILRAAVHSWSIANWTPRRSSWRWAADLWIWPTRRATSATSQRKRSLSHTHSLACTVNDPVPRNFAYWPLNLWSNADNCPITWRWVSTWLQIEWQLS